MDSEERFGDFDKNMYWIIIAYYTFNSFIKYNQGCKLLACTGRGEVTGVAWPMCVVAGPNVISFHEAQNP